MRSLAGFLHRHVLELAFAIFAVIFSVVLPFLDAFNLQGIMLASSYLFVGRNPYAIFIYPPPPGLFLPNLTGFAAYLLSGYSIAVANLTLKLVYLGALFVLAFAAGRIVRVGRGTGLRALALPRILLLSPLLFFLSFVWGEQDVYGLALTFVGLIIVLQQRDNPKASAKEAAGFALIVYASFTYYFPLFLLPTLLAYGRDARQFFRRLVWTAVSFSAFFVWFLAFPGWNFFARSVTTTATQVVSPYSILTVFSPTLGTPTGLQNSLAAALVVVLVALEVLIPVVLRWKGVSWAISAAFAFTLPFLLLNVVNGDEWAWPLPFLLVAFVLARPAGSSTLWLWCVQAYAIPTIVVANLTDSPGPGSGSGIYYWSYPIYHRAVALYTLVPDLAEVVHAAALLTWLALAGMLGALVYLGIKRHRGVGAVSPVPIQGSLPGLRTDDGGSSSAVTRASFSPSSPPAGVARRRAAVVVLLVIAVAGTVIADAVPAPTLTAEGDQQFPLAVFSEYSVANGSVTYSLSSSGTVLNVAGNYGNPSVVGTPWYIVNFSRSVEEENFSLDLGILPTAPPGFGYNTTVLSYGADGLNLVRPFEPPSSSAVLPAVQSANVTALPSFSSPQFTGNLTGARAFNGSSFEVYNASLLASAESEITLYFRWSGVQFDSNVVAVLLRGDQVFEVFGEGDLFYAGEKLALSPNWSFSAPQLVNPNSWQELTIGNTSTGTEIALDGLPMGLPAMVPPPQTVATLIVGMYEPHPLYVLRYAFSGTIVGPFDTSTSPPSLGPVQICPVELVPPSSGPGGCASFLSGTVSIHTVGPNTLSVSVGASAYSLTGSPHVVQFGRLCPVGPGLALHISAFATRTSASALGIAWVLDGVAVAPVLFLLVARWGFSGLWPRPVQPPTARRSDLLEPVAPPPKRGP